MEVPKKQVNSYLRFSTVAFQMGAIIGLMTWLGVWLDSRFNPAGAAFTVLITWRCRWVVFNHQRSN